MIFSTFHTYFAIQSTLVFPFKDKDYKPNKEDDSSCSEISNSPKIGPFKISKDRVRRRLFLPEKCLDTFNKEPCKVPIKRHISLSNKMQLNPQ